MVKVRERLRNTDVSETTLMLRIEVIKLLTKRYPQHSAEDIMDFASKLDALELACLEVGLLGGGQT